MTVFENVLDVLANIFGSNKFMILQAGESASDFDITTIRSIEVREDYSTITALEDKDGIDILSDRGLSGADLFRGEFFSEGRKGFHDVTCGAGSLKISYA